MDSDISKGISSLRIQDSDHTPDFDFGHTHSSLLDASKQSIDPELVSERSLPLKHENFIKEEQISSDDSVEKSRIRGNGHASTPKSDSQSPAAAAPAPAEILDAGDDNDEKHSSHVGSQHSARSSPSTVDIKRVSPAGSVTSKREPLQKAAANKFKRFSWTAGAPNNRTRLNGSPGAVGAGISANAVEKPSSSLGLRILDHPDFVSPLDNLDEMLPNAGNGSFALSGNESNEDIPIKRNGLLSFQDSRGESDSDRSLDHGDVSLHGIRREQAVTRKLETENMELRLKLQQYREMNASEQEMTRAKRQLARSEKRIDELEQALERKNQTIRELCEQRDSAAQQMQSEKTEELYSIINELQAAITQLEQESDQAQNTRRKVVSQAHADFPDLVSENAQVEELVAAVRHLMNENAKLVSQASTAAALRSQQSSLKDLLTDAGRPGDVFLSVQELLKELALESQESSSTRESLGREVRKLRAELTSMNDHYVSKTEALQTENNRLHASMENSMAAQRDLEGKLDSLEKLLMESRSTSYMIIRSFFAELFEIMGAEFQETVEQQLEEIMLRAKRDGLSKIPLLTELLVNYTRSLGETAKKGAQKPHDERRLWMLEREIQSLEHIIEMKWDKAGADTMLRAQVRDLRKQLKLEEEKRKSEWLEYQRSLQKTRR